MKLKNDITIDHYDIIDRDFWYDCSDGGYCVPEQLLESQEDIDNVNNAISVLKAFEQALTDLIHDSDYLNDYD